MHTSGAEGAYSPPGNAEDNHQIRKVNWATGVFAYEQGRP